MGRKHQRAAVYLYPLFHAACGHGEVFRSQKGRELVGRLLSRNDSANDVRHLGEGSEKRTQETALAMPLNSLVTFGRLTEEQLDELIMDLNKME